MTKTVPIIIPAYEPDDRLPVLLDTLCRSQMSPIIVVNDGSGEAYDHYYEKAEREYGCTVLKHAVNMGKGRALKNAFNYVLNQYPDAVGVVTADSDGQHTVESIKKVREKLLEQESKEKSSLILGVRNFNGKDIPWKSVFGNKLTRRICKYLCGIDVTDTQTGLRGIPRDFMYKLVCVSGERFEYETRMLIETKGCCEISEVSIETIYDSKENHGTHFNPVKDSIRIYKIFAEIFLKYMISSLSSSVIDILFFSLFIRLLHDWNSIYYVTAATVLARIISATYNYLINYKFVFVSEKNKGVSALKYFMLAAVQMTLSASLVTLGVYLLSFVAEIWIKIIVDVVLFLISYHIQQKYIF